MRFRAAVLHRVREPLRIEDVDLTALDRGDVLIRNRASGLCHTDLEVIDGTQPRPVPIILGHEGAGVVEEVGRDVKSVRPGDHVIASWNPHCGRCFYCARGQPVLCEAYTGNQAAGHLLDGRSRLSIGGSTLHHFGMVSSHAEYSVVPASGAIRIPHEIPLDRACLIGCGVVTGVGAVIRMARVRPGSSVAVVGCGAVGLNVIQGARIAGAATIVAVDRDQMRLVRARRFGATDCVLDSNATDCHAVIDAVRDLTAQRGADHVFEAAGNEAAMQVALEITRPAGDLVILGKTEAERMVAFRFGALAGEKRIIRSSYGGARPARDFPWLTELYIDGKLKLDELITTRLQLAEVNAGFEGMRHNAIVRAVIQF